MIAHAFLNELFNVFPILFQFKVFVGPMLSFQKRKIVTTLTNKHVVARFNYF